MEEEVAGIRRIATAAEGRHSFRTEVEVNSNSHRILVEAGCSVSVAERGQYAVRKLLTDIAEAGILHTAAVAAGVGEALGCSLPGYGSLGRGSTTCLRNNADVEGALKCYLRMRWQVGVVGGKGKS